MYDEPVETARIEIVQERIDDLCSGLDLLSLLGPCLPNSQPLLDALIFQKDGLKSGRL